MDEKVVVLVLHYNGKELLDDCLNSYLNNNYKNYEVVLIDNGSEDDSVQYVKQNFNQVRVIENKQNLGYSAGFNVGLNYAFNQANADYALVTNNDVKADCNVIFELVKTANLNKEIGFVTGKVYYYEQPTTLQTVGKKEDPIFWNGGHIGNREEDIGQYDFIRELAFADDVFTLVRRSLYLDIGGYDETFFLQCEEFDWQARAKQRGYKIYYTPYAKIWHKESMTLGKKSAKKAYYDARNPLIVIMKHKNKVFASTYLKNHFYRRVFKVSIRSILNEKDLYKALMIWKGFFSAIWWRYSKI